MIINAFNDIISDARYNEEKLYLVEPFDSDCGMFAFQRKFTFVTKANLTQSPEHIQTEHLTFRSHVFLSPVSDENSFGDGYYDLLVFRGNLDDDFFRAFYDLCKSYSDSSVPITFKDFFLELIEMFSIPSEQKYKNLIGLLGELFLIKWCDCNTKRNITPFWHNQVSGFEKYDFVFPSCNIEVKSSISDKKIFKIKHRQIFNDGSNFLVLVNLASDNSGTSLNDIVSFFKTSEEYKGNVNFLINLEKEVLRTNKAQRDEKYSMISLSAFSSKSIPTIGNIPQCISNIEYDYDFSNLQEVDIVPLILS